MWGELGALLTVFLIGARTAPLSGEGLRDCPELKHQTFFDLDQVSDLHDQNNRSLRNQKCLPTKDTECLLPLPFPVCYLRISIQIKMYTITVAYEGGEFWGVQTPRSEILKALQNRAKINPIVKTVKNC